MPLDVPPVPALTQVCLDQIWEVLDKYVCKAAVYGFGSRFHGSALKAFSDVDLCLKQDYKIPESTMSRLREAFDESNIPIKVDVIDWSATDERFQKLIQNDLTLLPRILENPMPSK